MKRQFPTAVLAFATLLAPLAPRPLHGQTSTPSAPASPIGGAAGTTSTTTEKPRTATIRGRVVRADTGDPIRRAQVIATANEPRGVLTDSEGRYQIEGLPPGTYQVTALKGGYAETIYGQRRPFRPGRPVTVVAGQVLERIDLSMLAGAVVSGRILDEAGEPLSGVSVGVTRYGFVNGRRQLAPGHGDTTDDRGEFRVFGLPPGDYYIRASLSAPFGVTGGAYTPTFYPGTPLLAEAQAVTLEAGTERNDVAFALSRAQAVSVSGIVRSRDGALPAAAFVMLVPASSGAVFLDGTTAMGAMRPDGSFMLGNVLPGTYRLDARLVTNRALQSQRLDVVVGNRDVSGLVLEVGRGAVARGRIRFDTTSPPPGLAPEDVRIVPVALGDPHFTSGSMPDPPRDDWTFELTGLSGKHVIRGGALRNEWHIKSVHLDGVDVTDTPIDFSRDVDGLEVLLTREQTDLSGLVRTDRGAAVTWATVLVFADDAEKWGPQTRFVQTAQIDQRGRYQIRGLPEGDYVAVAVEDIEPGEEGDVELLQQLRSRGERVRLTHGQTHTLNLTVGEN